MSCIVPRCRHVRDLPAVAGRVEVDRAHAGYHRIENVLRCVIFRALVREKGWRDRHIGTLKFLQIIRLKISLRSVDLGIAERDLNEKRRGCFNY